MLTTITRRLRSLLLFPCLLSLGNQVLPVVDCMLDFLRVVCCLERSSVIESVENAGEESCIPSNLDKRKEIPALSRREKMTTHVQSLGNHGSELVNQLAAQVKMQLILKRAVETLSVLKSVWDLLESQRYTCL